MDEQTENILDSLIERVRKVRRWLVLLAFFKITAVCLVFVSVYIAIYAWLDHRLHFNGFGRITALVFLAAGVIYLLLRLCKLLISHISLSQAANYIESKSSFEQQLVAAVEYHEDNADYPYSRELAGELVRRVNKVCADDDFDASVSKWHLYVFLAVIVFGLGITSFYLFENLSYFSRYFVRLIQPLAHVEPLPPTGLEPITKDMVVEPNSIVTLSAGIKGRLPEFGRLVLVDANETSSDPNDRDIKSFQLTPVTDEDGKPKFETKIPFETAGRFRYRFQAGAAVSPWQNITVCTIPEIKKITANVKLGDNWRVKPYEQDVEDFSLEVIENSIVTLTVLATEELSKVVIKHLDGRTLTKELNSVASFTFKFDAEQNGFIEFVLSSAKEVTNENVQPLQVKLRVDASAKFKLLTPSSDYLATNVASVPISFEVTDDFGLTSASLTWEIAGANSETFSFPVEDGTRSKKITRILELENYDLNVGDSIIFYAEATEINTSGNLTRSVSSSDIYFIEIKPYRQRWHQIKPKLPGQPKQGLEPDKAMLHDKLIDVLEYTRAFVKKTWKIAGKGKLNKQDRKRLESIYNDVGYAGEQLELIKKNPRYGFGSDEIETLNSILSYYNQAGMQLIVYKPVAAFVPEKHAYRILRKFVIELEKVLTSGSGSPPPLKLDKVKMEELVHLTRYDKEQIEWELERLSQKLEQLAREQEELKKTFERFLKEQKKAEQIHQKTKDEKSWIAKNEKKPETKPCQSCENSEEGCAVCRVSPTVEGALKPPPPGGSGKQASGKSGKASMAEKMEMLQAKQKAMQARVESLKEELKKLTSAENNKANKKAQKNLKEAAEQMEKFNARLTEASYKPKNEQEKFAQALDALKRVGDEIADALAQIRKGLKLTEEQILAADAADLAEEMAELSELLLAGENPFSKEELLKMLNEAERIITAMSDLPLGKINEFMAVANASGNVLMRSAAGNLSFGSAREVIKGSGSGNALIPLTKFFNKVSQQLWYMALRVKKLDSGVAEDQPSDARFYEMENKFFENAARFGE